MLTPVKLEKIKEEFKELVRMNNLDGLILADVEGLPIISQFQENMDEDTLASAGAAIFTAGLMTVSDTNKKGLSEVILDSPDGYIIYSQVSDDYVLGLISPPDAKLGILKMIVKKVEKLLKELEA
jgi:predicted regulator of Ras-like GTPase activity (Roadblock/LC7/MglB family)